MSANFHADGWDLRPEPLDSVEVDRLVSDDELPDDMLSGMAEGVTYTDAQILRAKRQILAARLEAERDEARYESRRARWGDD